MKTTIDDHSILWKKLGNDTGVDIFISIVEGYILDIMENLGELFDLNPKTRVVQKGEMYPDWIPVVYKEIPSYELVLIQTVLEMKDRPTRLQKIDDELEVFEKKYEIELVGLLNSIETNVLRGDIGFPYSK
tara:strand:- start:48 stop:440 length:393 start_codon:yes stop_codon:yes gene_type:complete